MLVDGSSTGIAMCHIAVAVNEQLESGVGTERLFEAHRLKTALRGKADIGLRLFRCCTH